MQDFRVVRTEPVHSEVNNVLNRGVPGIVHWLEVITGDKICNAVAVLHRVKLSRLRISNPEDEIASPWSFRYPLVGVLKVRVLLKNITEEINKGDAVARLFTEGIVGVSHANLANCCDQEE